MRTVAKKLPRAHSLALAVKGVNALRPGKYVCRCGKQFTSVKLWESHRSESYRKAKDELL